MSNGNVNKPEIKVAGKIEPKQVIEPKTEQKVIEPKQDVEVKVAEPEITTEVKPEEKVDTTSKEPTTEVKPEEKTGAKPEELPVAEKTSSLEDLYKELHLIKENEILETLKAFKGSKVEEKIFVAELIDIHGFLMFNEAKSVSNGNGRLNSLLLRILDAEDKVKFDIVNKLFALSNKIYEPAYLQRDISFTRSSEVAINYGLLITIIELLSDPEKRKDNKKQVVNLSYLKIPVKSLNFLKSYYKL